MFDGTASTLSPFLKTVHNPVLEYARALHGFTEPSPTGLWVGDRIMCVGDSLSVGDYPEGVFTEEELAEIGDESFDNLVMRAFKSGRTPLGYRENDIVVVRALCNLTNHEYVRDDLLAAKFTDSNESGYPAKPQLANVVLSRICWSSDPSASMSYDGEINRGCWAGHRFEIIVFPEEGLGEGWKDVSEEAGDEIRAIWDSERY